jgi:hypothetical protein
MPTSESVTVGFLIAAAGLTSEQATAARRDYFAGSNSGVVGQDVRDVDDVVEKFTGDPPGAGVTPPPRGASSSGGAPLCIGRLQRR